MRHHLVLLAALLAAAAFLAHATVAMHPMSIAQLEAEMAPTDPTYDHQTTTYTATQKPVTVTSNGGALAVTPFFSPDHSIDTLTNLVLEAQHSIQIYTPSYSSWTSCTPFTGCAPCTVQQMLTTETFPIFFALLKQLAAGVSVRIISNDYGNAACKGAILPLELLTLAGAEVRYYTTTTFMHTKYVAIDGKKAAVSSVNFSKTSFLRNRESGFVVAGDNSVISFYAGVFDADWAVATPLVVAQTYSPAELAMIRSPPKSIPMPTPYSFKCNTQSPAPVNITSAMSFTAYASPDFATDVLMATVDAARSSFDLSVYQITDPALCQKLIDMKNAGIQLRIFTSWQIVDAGDAASAAQCYARLADAGVAVMQSCHGCTTYSHQKYWIVDRKTVGLSSGNWSPTDFPPLGNYTFPPFSAGDAWIKTNRDLNVVVTNTDVVEVFQQVFDLDYSQAAAWSRRTAA